MSQGSKVPFCSCFEVKEAKNLPQEKAEKEKRRRRSTKLENPIFTIGNGYSTCCQLFLDPSVLSYSYVFVSQKTHALVIFLAYAGTGEPIKRLYCVLSGIKTVTYIHIADQEIKKNNTRLLAFSTPSPSSSVPP